MTTPCEQKRVHKENLVTVNICVGILYRAESFSLCVRNSSLAKTEKEQTVQKLTDSIKDLEAELNEKGSQEPDSHHVNEEKKAVEERAEKAEKSLEDSLVTLEKKTLETEELWSLCNTNDEKMVKILEHSKILMNI